MTVIHANPSLTKEATQSFAVSEPVVFRTDKRTIGFRANDRGNELIWVPKSVCMLVKGAEYSLTVAQWYYDRNTYDMEAIQ